jgi:hypothetical protein
MPRAKEAEPREKTMSGARRKAEGFPHITRQSRKRFLAPALPVLRRLVETQYRIPLLELPVTM